MYPGPITQQEIAEILSLYESCNHNASEAARILAKRRRPKHRQTIKRIWKENISNYKPNQHGGPRYALEERYSRFRAGVEDIKIILRAYEGCNGNSAEAARATGYSSTRCCVYWAAAGFIDGKYNITKGIEKRVKQALAEMRRKK
ncbi:MAG: hypothetical protein QXD13_01895 [Candidatus Pacearchaeota archaeon]